MHSEMNSTSKAISGEKHDSYFHSLEPGKALALTMNFPQHDSFDTKKVAVENKSIQHQISNTHSQCNHITTDPQGCLDCISSMFGPNYAPFAAFMQEFSEFAQTQKTIAMKQNDIIENFLSYHQQQYPKKTTLNEQELQHVFTFGTWSNGKKLFSSNPQFLVGCSLIILSIYLATIRDVTDPVLAFIRAYSRINGDMFQYFNIIMGLIGIGALYIGAVTAYCSGLFGHSTIVTRVALIFNIIGLLSSVILICIVLFMGDTMKASLPVILESNVGNFESDTSTNSLSYAWTLMHKKYHCCIDGVLRTGQTVANRSRTFASLHPGWLVPESCCISTNNLCVQVPTMLTNISGIIYLMNLKIAIHRMNTNNNELVKSLFALKSRNLASIHNDLTKNPFDKSQQIKTDRKTKEKQHLHIPGYFPITPTILQIRKPEQSTYLHYGL
ncbi:unnamed protein product [Adineta steineri]|uniref:Tetraspanin n=1 Tax=Adineta steineri TaxID=433720 RepID=A0A818X8C4_9BILA|nr:unnamed protein product [Adineta steineri]